LYNVGKRRRTSSRTPRTRRGQNTTLGTLAGIAILVILYFFFPELLQTDQPPVPDTSGGPATGQRADTSVNFALGNPSEATSDPANPNNYLIVRDQYVLSYNRDARIPNWVSWHLSPADMGDVDRSEFQPDTTLPDGWYKVRPSDYTNSGYDRGHMAPSADRTATREDNEMVFLMTNIVPQAPDNNQGPWVQLEEYCRDLAREGNELYIISGVSGTQATLPKGKVRVPERVWKVIVVLPEGNNDLERIDQNTQVITVDMPNRQGIRDNAWREYLTSVDRIEEQTGYDLLGNLDPTIEARLEVAIASP
jgi:endonuclease G